MSSGGRWPAATTSKLPGVDGAVVLRLEVVVVVDEAEGGRIPSWRSARSRGLVDGAAACCWNDGALLLSSNSVALGPSGRRRALEVVGCVAAPAARDGRAAVAVTGSATVVVVVVGLLWRKKRLWHLMPRRIHDHVSFLVPPYVRILVLVQPTATGERRRYRSLGSVASSEREECAVRVCPLVPAAGMHPRMEVVLLPRVVCCCFAQRWQRFCTIPARRRKFCRTPTKRVAVTRQRAREKIRSPLSCREPPANRKTPQVTGSKNVCVCRCPRTEMWKWGNLSAIGISYLLRTYVFHVVICCKPQTKRRAVKRLVLIKI